MRKKSGENRGNALAAVLLVLLVLLVALIAGVVFLRFYRQGASVPEEPEPEPDLSGSWRMELDLTQLARARVETWLAAAQMGDRVDVPAYLPRLSVPVLLRIEANGSWSRSVDVDGLDAARAQAEGAMAKALRELLCLRVSEAGWQTLTDEEAEELVIGAIGMSSEQYLADYGPELLPGMEELRSDYEGQGRWEIEGETIRLDGSTSEHFLTDGTLLVLDSTERTEVYRRETGK